MTVIASTTRPAAQPCTPYPAGKTTALDLTLSDFSVLAISRRLHDEKCRDRHACPRRDGHALDCFEANVRKTLGALVDASTAREI